MLSWRLHPNIKASPDVGDRHHQLAATRALFEDTEVPELRTPFLQPLPYQRVSLRMITQGCHRRLSQKIRLCRSTRHTASRQTKDRKRQEDPSTRLYCDDHWSKGLQVSIRQQGLKMSFRLRHRHSVASPSSIYHMNTPYQTRLAMATT